ncbi:MAG: hypothetical protein US68_C0001G0074 [Candidatus Shapirobacteria bacterium GW2011_GWE1_38_10]|uniref:Uncharacterized protein n=1 Tax=Candidatus Shapirobacteria bacterium GW2011_GWE1_38_10 TaxID=1618488 RepID=A0A0G0IIN6_9BACT|nr:MAG: hypothetical protein US46_C0004G0008 [Candidatus Shapirobacteria bacterium GW2011_GWF2_37_20]KKQ50875.1 MAG: hypothetical protein US68_C0001G0074 [Candidatus Shapirobacteria bacterium GW2011_GWE1_38_10]HBP51088.1 hypothetical protein [Candidatus Shapirobacteria bacterium]
MKKHTFIKLLLSTIIISGFIFIYPQKINSVPPKNVKNVLSNSQFSYYGGVGVGTTANDTIIKLDISSFPSKTSNNLFIGDTVSIGVGGSQSTYTIKDIGNTGTIMVNTGISAVSSVAGGSIIATRSAIHTVSFEPQVSATGGIWQVLIKSTSDLAAEKSSDAIPDQQGFDYGTLIAGAVTCPWGATATVGTTAAVALGSPAVTSYYHVIQCALGAGITNPAGTGVTGVITIGNATNALINPSPSNTAAQEGNANIFTFILRHLDSSSVLLDQTPGKIAVVESVRVTATVDPSITFYIDGVGNTLVGSTACGTGTTLSSGAVNTTGDQVIFGSLALSGFNQLGQRLSCVTNAPGGYVVTVHEAGVMKNVNTATTIPDTLCNGGNCTPTSATAWATPSTARSEFGYTMTNIGSSIPFVPGQFKPFGIGNANAQPIMLKTSIPSTTESANVCYRLSITTVQEAGDYESKIVYTATSTF